jgi:hypothetical protein
MKSNVISLANERIRRLAVANGCKPLWSAHYNAWCCTCGVHYGDSQCSIIDMKSAARKAK